jgi:hypothetical protein
VETSPLAAAPTPENVSAPSSAALTPMPPIRRLTFVETFFTEYMSPRLFAAGHCWSLLVTAGHCWIEANSLKLLARRRI